MNHRTHVLALLGTLTLAPLACSTADNVDLGSTKGSALVDYAATWTGYAEAYKFDHGTSDRVRITLDANGDGTLEIGDQPLYPAPTNFDVGYPVADERWGGNDSITRFRPGFRYPVHGTRIETGRLRLYVDPKDPFATWCGGQTTYVEEWLNPPPGISPGYSCAPIGTLVMTGAGCTIESVNGTPPIPINCGKAALCTSLGTCTCTASGCTVAHYEDDLIQVDAALDTAGTSMVGTIVVHDVSSDARVTIRLTRN